MKQNRDLLGSDWKLLAPGDPEGPLYEGDL